MSSKIEWRCRPKRKHTTQMNSLTSYLVKIHLVRTAASTENNDDIIKIRKNISAGEFELYYSDANENGASNYIHTLRTTEESDLTDHLYLLFKTLSIDEDPFLHVQLTLPAMPRVIVSVHKLKDTYYCDHFMSLIKNALTQFDYIDTSTSRKYSPAAQWETARINESSRNYVNHVLGDSVDRYFNNNYDTYTNNKRMNEADSQDEPSIPSAPKKRRSTRLASANINARPRNLVFD